MNDEQVIYIIRPGSFSPPIITLGQVDGPKPWQMVIVNGFNNKVEIMNVTPTNVHQNIKVVALTKFPFIMDARGAKELIFEVTTTHASIEFDNIAFHIDYDFIKRDMASLGVVRVA